MPESKNSLNDLLHEVRRAAESREILTERRIKKLYNQLYKDLQQFLSTTYIKYAKVDGRLFWEQLESNAGMAKFMKEIVHHVDGIAPAIQKQMMQMVDDVYKTAYSGMVQSFQKSESEQAFMQKLKDVSVNPHVMTESMKNNISKLTIPTVTGRAKQALIYDIQQTINIGLINGDRYETMAKRIEDRCNVSYNKALCTARTETHRNIESGFFRASKEIQSGMEGSGYVYVAIWRNMGDERVRPQVRRHTKKGWTTSYSKNGANHMKMDGAIVLAGEDFTLTDDGAKAKAPGQSGKAHHDCNCRCFLEYDIMTAEEFEQKTGRKLPAKYHKMQKEPSVMEDITDQQHLSMADNGSINWPPKGEKITEQEYKELREFAESKGVTLRGFKKSDVDLTLAREVIDDAAMLLDSFPILKGSGRKPFTLELSNTLSACDFAQTHLGVTHVIQLNADAFRNRARLAAEYEKLADIGWFVKGSDYHSIIYHESGHLLSDLYHVDALEVAKKILKTNSEPVISSFMLRNISQYASDSKDGIEYVSEVFSAYNNGNRDSFVLQFLKDCGII